MISVERSYPNKNRLQRIFCNKQTIVVTKRCNLGTHTFSANLFTTLRVGHPNRWRVMGSQPMQIDGEELVLKNSFHPDFLEDYPDVALDLPTPHDGQELVRRMTHIFWCQSRAWPCDPPIYSGKLVFVGSMPVIWQSSKQQEGCIATSTHWLAERCLWLHMERLMRPFLSITCYIPINCPTNMIGDRVLKSPKGTNSRRNTSQYCTTTSTCEKQWPRKS